MYELSKNKIIQVNSVKYEEGIIKASITTSHFGRITTKPYQFSLSEWAMVVERGYIDD